MSAVLALSGGAEDVATARSLLREVVRLAPGDWDLGHLDVLVEQLLTVALPDRGTATELRVSVAPGRLRVQVHATSEAVPSQRSGFETSATLLGELADDWGAYSVHTGEGIERVCWFELHAPVHEDPGPSTVALPDHLSPSDGALR